MHTPHTYTYTPNRTKFISHTVHVRLQVKTANSLLLTLSKRIQHYMWHLSMCLSVLVW